jgi:TetR/AcrR family transcriptional repressor of nem operon
MKSQTRKTILTQGARLVYKKGFNHTGIGEILKAANVPKGSFYHYFASKEDFGLALIDHMAAWAASVGDAALNDPDASPLTRLHKYFQAYADRLEQNNFHGGCPVGNLCQEMSDQNERFRQRLESILEQMREKIGQCLTEARQSGEVSQDLDIDTTARFIVSAWQGTLLQAKAMKSAAPLSAFWQMVFDRLLKSAPACRGQL